MVDVVETDITGDPLEEPGQRDPGTARERRFRVIPIGVPPPVGPRETMLHVEKEDGWNSPESQDHELDRYKSGRPHPGGHEDGEPGNRQICQVDRYPEPPICGFRIQDEALNYDELDQWADGHQEESMMVDPVIQAPAGGGGPVLVGRHRPDITGSSPVEVTCRSMVPSVRSRPVGIRGEDDNPDDTAHQSV